MEAILFDVVTKAGAVILVIATCFALHTIAEIKMLGKG
jgi:hypothetical protein